MNLQEMADKMDKAIDVLEEQIIGIRSAGVTTAFIDSFKVKYYGQLTSVKTLAYTTADKGRILVKVYDISSINLINEVLNSSGLNTYVLSKDTIVVSIPSMCGEEKDRTIKRLNKLGEETKIAIRNIRKNYRKLDLSSEKEIQNITDKAISIVNSLIEKKVTAI
jgi:ribosome recycling factor